MKTNITKDALTCEWDEYNTLLNGPQLSDRWDCSTKKLEADRLKGEGPPFIKIGRLVRYRLSDVIEYENSRQRQNTSQKETPQAEDTRTKDHKKVCIPTTFPSTRAGRAER